MCCCCKKKKKLTEDEVQDAYKDKYCRERRQSAYQKSNCLTKLFYCWCNPILGVSSKSTFQQDMHFQHRAEDLAENQIADFQKYFKYYYKKNYKKIKETEFQIKKPGIIYSAIWKSYRCMMIGCGFLALLFSVFQYFNSGILYQSQKAFDRFDDKGNRVIDPKEIGILLGTLTASKILQSIFNTQLGFQLGLLGFKIRNVQCGMIIDKALKKSVSREREFTVGEMINLTSADAQKFSSIGQQGIQLVICPFNIIMGIGILWVLMGNAVWPAMVCVFIVFFVNFSIGKSLTSNSKKVMIKKDERMKAVNEAFTNIRYVKMSATENYFLDRMCKIKQDELRAQNNNFMNITFVSAFNRFSPVAFMVSLIGFYYLLGNYLTIQVLFTSLQIYNTFSQSMNFFPFLASFWIDMIVSGDRINNFLLSEQVDDTNIVWRDTSDPFEETAIEIKNGNFHWIDPRKEEFIKLKKDHEDASMKKKGCCGCGSNEFKLPKTKYNAQITALLKKNLSDELLHGEIDKLVKDILLEKDDDDKLKCFGVLVRMVEQSQFLTNDQKKNLHKLIQEPISGRLPREQNAMKDVVAKAMKIEADIREKDELKSKSKKKKSKQPSKVNLSQTDLQQTLLRDKKKENSDEIREAQTNTNFPSIASLEHGSVDNNPSQLMNKPKLDLKNVNIEIKKGSCVAIIGKVGCGKSSLLTALFGEMYCESKGELINSSGRKESVHLFDKPDIYINGSVSYVSQKTWVRSQTIKDNILFHKALEDQRYNDAIHYSAMTTDLEAMPDKDRTMLGDKGINLSGGQKVRLSIARAQYADRDIYLFDDPISALDIHVGKFIMEETINKYLKGKTRVIATHAVAFLPHFDYIYVVDEGKIIQQGDWEYIKETEEYSVIKKIIDKTEENKRKASGEVEDAEDALALIKQISSTSQPRLQKQMSLQSKCSSIYTRQDSSEIHEDLLKKNSLQVGEIDIKNLMDLTIVEMEEENSRVLNSDEEEKEVMNRAVKQNIKDKNETKIESVASLPSGLKKNEQLIANIISAEDRATGSVSLGTIKKFIKLSGGYSIIFVMSFLMIINIVCQGGNTWLQQYFASQKPEEQQIGQFLLLYVGIAVSQNLTMTLRGQYNFNRGIWVSKQMNFYMCFKLLHTSINQFWDRVPLGRVQNRFSRDQQVIDREMPYAINVFVMALFTMILDFIMATVGSSQLLWFFIAFYVQIGFTMQRYYMHAQRELTRLQAISTSPVVQIFTETLNGVVTLRIFKTGSEMKTDYHKAMDDNYSNQLCLMGVRSWFGVRIEMLSLLIILPGFFFCLYYQKSAGMFALMLNYILSVTEDIAQLLTSISNQENRFISFERCNYFMELETESGYRNIEEIPNKFFKNQRIIGHITGSNTEENWANNGRVEFKNFSCKYQPTLPYVLRSINIRIKSGRKVGIVGRTGAGKTTFLSAIYRTFEKYTGEILIDGKEINGVDLKKLRTRMTVIPQDPNLFGDTLKKNLDPNEEYSDEKIIKVLKDFGIWDKFEHKGGLLFMVDGSGQNLSQGEKQLLCMGRAMLSNNKLILLDEATANIDIETEHLIQKSIEANFGNCTILMIAHRLNTIMFCDKVLVLDKGRIVEYGSTHKLKDNPNTYFGKMLARSKDVEDALK